MVAISAEYRVKNLHNWGISAGLASGSLTTYSAPGEPAIAGATAGSVTNAADLAFTATPKLRQAFSATLQLYQQNLFGVNLGQVTVAGGSAVDGFIDNNLVGTTSWRVWYDGVGYQPVGQVTGTASYTPVLGVDFNRNDTLGSPSQSGFRVVAGSAASQAANAPSYTKTIGAHQVTISQPDGRNFEFRGANGDGTRAIPGGDTSRSFLVSDFIATREGMIDILINGLAAGDYRFRSWHLDPSRRRLAARHPAARHRLERRRALPAAQRFRTFPGKPMSLRSLLFLPGAAACHAAPPNVLFIAVDDLRPELGCYGESHMVTPHIDTLARQGRLFRNHYVAVPTCGASRYALMSGLRPTAASDDNNAFDAMPTSLPAQPESWVDLLRRSGWRTVSLGKVSHEPDGYQWNFPSNYDIGRSSATFPDMRHSWNEVLYGHDKWGAQRYPLFAYANGTGRVSAVSPAWESGVDGTGQSLPDEAYPDGQMARAAIGKLREFADDGSRFCLALGFFKPHLPFNAPKAYFDLYNPATLPAPNPATAPTGANAATLANSGEVNSYSGGGDRAKLRHAYFACVSYVDAQVGKVLADLCGLAPPASAAGSSLVPLLRNPFAPGKNHAYSRYGSLTTIRTSAWRLINTSGDYDLYNLSSFRYELADVSATNPAVVSTLSANINTQGTRPGSTYAAWAGGDPLLIDPNGDGDQDGTRNALEYGAGTDPLDLADRPTPVFSFEDLTSLGFSNHELVYRFPVDADTDDFTLLPASSTDLATWGFESLEFLDAIDSGGSVAELRFRVTGPPALRRFFRLGTSED